MVTIPDERYDEIANDPFCATLGIELTALESGGARTELTVREELLNFHGTPHGGVVYSLADAAFAAASNADGDTALALETNISYLSAADVGDRLVAVAEREDETRRTGTYRVDVAVEAVGEEDEEETETGDGSERTETAREGSEGTEEVIDREEIAIFRGRVYKP
ncbi:hotdog fold thioesterase (plasmid) [Haladaptatus sp. SPP-AMP-3]|uniref:hotdog fold thioesterase n=1 Tax=Haladaptatus sp. SPP-AMP-3 TaxID=3121295 RepID=UPI003C2F6296